VVWLVKLAWIRACVKAKLLDHLASFPGLHTELLSLAARKMGRRLGRIYHVMRAAADFTYCLLTSGFVISPSLFFP